MHRFIFFILMIVFIGGCTMQGLLYRNLDWLAKRQLNSYFDLNSKQKDEFYPKVDTFINQHKTVLLADVITMLKKAEDASEGGFEENETQELFQELAVMRTRYMKLATPLVADFFQALGDEQWQHFSEQIAEKNELYVELLAADSDDFAEHRQERLEESVENYQSWFGELSKGQIEQIATYWPLTKEQAEQRLQRRRLQQQWFIKFSQTASKEAFSQFHDDWADDINLLRLKSLSKDEALAREQNSFLRFQQTFLRSLSDKQLTFFRKRVAEIISDLRDLKSS